MPVSTQLDENHSGERKPVEFGQRLRELRREKRWTLRALADAVGVDFTYLSKIENG